MTLRSIGIAGRAWPVLSSTLVGCAVAMTFAVAQPAAAQTRRFSNEDASLAAVYGRGVHAYFAGRLSEADQLLTQAIEAGSRDPRAFYFRGMTRLGTGRRYEAEQDIRIGASLEAEKPSMRRSVSRSLTRVQGTKRKWLEQIRRDAQLDVVRNQAQESQRRYGNQPAPNQQRVLRRPVEVPLDQLGQQPPQIVHPQARPAAPVEPAAPAEAASSTPPVTPEPAADAEPAAPVIEATPQPTLVVPAEPALPESPAEQPAAPAEATPAAPADEQPESDPFGVEEPMPAEAPAESPAATPAEPSTPAEPPTPPASDDPFDFGLEDDAPAETDPTEADAAASPFGEAAAPTPAAEPEMVEPEPTPVDPPAAAEEDPFGAADAEPTQTEPTPTEQPEDAADPFATPELDAPAADATSPSDLAADPTAQPGEAGDDAPPTTEANPRRFLGVLGRIVGSATPDLAMPQLPTLPEMGPPAGQGPDEEAFDFGPGAEPGEGEFDAFEPMPASPAEEATADAPAEQPPAAEPAESDDPFGADPFGGSDDPFGGLTDDSEAEETETPEAEEVEPAEESASDADEPAESDASDSESTPDEDDPFGGFGEF